MRILGIETSCDETAAAVVENGTTILSNVVASSAELHIKTGGVIPEQAARQQVKSIIPVINEALLTIDHLPSAINSIDAIAVTVGPGLIGSLLVGVETAKTLSYLWNKPISPVNHLVAHVYANWISPEQPSFPALALVVSGGHTDLVLIEKHPSTGSIDSLQAGSGKALKWIGGTRDDAGGEAFDKTARLLGLPYPGGPSIAASAAKFQITNTKLQIKLPRPMINENNFDFSFSGLKTAVLREVNNLKAKRLINELTTNHLAYEVQEAICDCLVIKTLKAVKKFTPKALLLAGGVSANLRLREKFIAEIEKEKINVDLRFPTPKFCTDKAAAIASCAYFYTKGGLQHYSPISWQKIEANPELTIMGKV